MNTKQLLSLKLQLRLSASQLMTIPLISGEYKDLTLHQRDFAIACNSFVHSFLYCVLYIVYIAIYTCYSATISFASTITT